jgi:hypothetical protein
MSTKPCSIGHNRKGLVKLRLRDVEQFVGAYPLDKPNLAGRRTCFTVPRILESQDKGNSVFGSGVGGLG